MTDPTAGHAIYILQVTAVEVTSAVIRRLQGGTVSAMDATTVLRQFRQDLATEYQGIEVTPALLSVAVALVEMYGLQAYDALQLAAATMFQTYRTGLALAPLILVSSDHELNTAAVAAGLLVEAPNTHP